MQNPPQAPFEAMGVPPFVSVVAPHYNDLENLARCLAALACQSWPAQSFEVIVADNNSACGIDAVRAMVGAQAGGGLARVVVVPAPIQGAGLARNAGAQAAKGDILAFIDSDCRAEPEWIAAGVRALGGFDYVGGAVTTSVEDPATMSAAQAYEVEFAFNFRKYVERDKFSGTGNLFVRSDVFTAVGPFRAGVSEDVDWCHRANAMGYSIGYAPAAVVSHPARDDWRGLCAKWRRVVRESHRLAVERPGGRRHFALRAVAVALSPVAHTPRVLASSRLKGLRQKALGLAGLYGIRLYRAGVMARLVAGLD